jgi:hypothetical protein
VRADRPIPSSEFSWRLDIMWHNLSRAWLISGWLGTLAVIIVFSVAMGATLSTSALLLALGMVPIMIIMISGAGSSSPTVAEILHTAEAADKR